MCSKKKFLALESRDLSRAEKEKSACKADQIHKMTTIFPHNDTKGYLERKQLSFCEFAQLSNQSFLFGKEDTIIRIVSV